MRAICVFAALVLVALASAALDEDAGVRRWWHLRGELADAERRIEALGREVETLRRQASRLEDDDFEVERAIREDLGLARPGQLVVRLARPQGAGLHQEIRP